MKQLVCEMCGGKELVKQDGIFVCQSCSTKYSVEEAKKMMVTIDNSGKVENALKSARRAMENKSYEQAEKFYNIVLEEEPENWEATFYSVYSKVNKPGLTALNAEDSIKNCLGTVLKDIKKIDNVTKQNEAIKQIHADLCCFENILDIFTEKLISEFGENEFTNSIRVQCFEILLRRINDKKYIPFHSSATHYANVLTKINPTSHELARYNIMKEQSEKLREKRKKSDVRTCWGCFIFIIVVIVLVYIVARIAPQEGQTQNVPSGRATSEEQIKNKFHATANLLYGELKDAYTVNSRECIGGKPIQLQGNIEDIVNTPTNAYVDIKPNIRAFLSSGEAARKSLKRNNSIRLAGECQGQKSNKIIIRDAVIVD